MTLWQKNGGDPATLPFQDAQADGTIWTNLADNPEGRAACGWTQAPDEPPYNPATQQVAWVNGTWVVQPIPTPPTPPVSRTIARIDFVRRFTVTEMARIQGSADPIVKNFLFMLTIIQAVDLDNADTQNGVHYLEAQSLLDAAGRSATILG